VAGLGFRQLLVTRGQCSLCPELTNGSKREMHGFGIDSDEDPMRLFERRIIQFVKYACELARCGDRRTIAPQERARAFACSRAQTSDVFVSREMLQRGPFMGLRLTIDENIAQFKSRV